MFLCVFTLPVIGITPAILVLVNYVIAANIPTNDLSMMLAFVKTSEAHIFTHNF